MGSRKTLGPKTMSSFSALSNAVVKKTIPFRCFSYNKTRTTTATSPSSSSLLLSQCAVSSIRKLPTPVSIEAKSTTPLEVIEDPPPYSPDSKPGIEFPKPPMSPPVGPDIQPPKPDVLPPREPPPLPPDVVPPPPPDMPPRPPGPEIFPPPNVDPRPPGPEIVPPPGFPKPDIRPPPHGPVYMCHLIPSR